jgi:hypothetical protein
MSCTVVDPRSQVPTPTRESALPKKAGPDYPVPTARPNKSNGQPIAALLCATVAIGLSVIYLPAGIALGVVGLTFGLLATVMGAIGLRRAASKVVGIAAW